MSGFGVTSATRNAGLVVFDGFVFALPAGLLEQPANSARQKTQAKKPEMSRFVDLIRIASFV